MKYTLDYLLDNASSVVSVTYSNGDYDVFDGVDMAIADYAIAIDDAEEMKTHDIVRDYDILTPEECFVGVYPMHADGTAREDWTLCSVEMFLDIVNGGGKVNLNALSLLPDNEPY